MAKLTRFVAVATLLGATLFFVQTVFTAPNKARVVVTKTPKSISQKSLRTPRPPQALTTPMRSQMADKIRRLAGVSKGNPTPPAPSARLSANEPRSGRSWITVTNGSTAFSRASLAGTMQIKAGDSNSFITMEFATQTGKTYMLDCFVGSDNGDSSWQLNGGIEATMTPTSGHLIGGFIANRISTRVVLRKPGRPGSPWGFLYLAELTQID